MTPAINIAQKNNIQYRIHEYIHESTTESYGLEAAEKLSVNAMRVFKTLVVMLDNEQLAVGVISVMCNLNLKLMAKALGAKKATMANPADVERSTGYVLGGVSPLGQKKRLKTVVDVSALDHETIFVSAGRRGLEIELAPSDLQQLTQAAFVEISR